MGRSFEVRSSIGRRSAGDQSDRVKLRSLIVLRPPCPTPRARCLRSKSSSSKWAPCGLRVCLRRRGCDRMRTQRRSPGTHTEVRPGVVVVVQRGVSSSSSSSSCRGALPRCLWWCHLRHCAGAVLVLMLVQLCWCRWCSMLRSKIRGFAVLRCHGSHLHRGRRRGGRRRGGRWRPWRPLGLLTFFLVPVVTIVLG